MTKKEQREKLVRELLWREEQRKESIALYGKYSRVAERDSNILIGMMWLADSFDIISPQEFVTLNETICCFEPLEGVIK